MNRAWAILKSLLPYIGALISLHLFGILVDRMYDAREVLWSHTSNQKDQSIDHCSFPLPSFSSRAQGSVLQARDAFMRVAGTNWQQVDSEVQVQRISIPGWWDIRCPGVWVRTNVRPRELRKLGNVILHVTRKVDQIVAGWQPGFSPKPQGLIRIRCFRDIGQYGAYSKAFEVQRARAFYDPNRNEVATFLDTRRWDEFIYVMAHEVAHVRAQSICGRPKVWLAAEGFSEAVALKLMGSSERLPQGGSIKEDPLALVAQWDGLSPDQIDLDDLLGAYRTMASLAMYWMGEREGSASDWFEMWKDTDRREVLKGLIGAWHRALMSG